MKRITIRQLILALTVLNLILAFYYTGIYLLSDDLNLNVNLNLTIAILLVVISGISSYIAYRFQKNNVLLFIGVLCFLTFGLILINYPEFIALYWNYLLATIVAWTGLIFNHLLIKEKLLFKLISLIPILLLFTCILLKVDQKWIFELLLGLLILTSGVSLYIVVKSYLKVRPESV